MQMKCSKNLERAIVLGLILSTGVCGSAWAENNLEGHFIVNGAGNPDKFPTIDYDKTYNNIDISIILRVLLIKLCIGIFFGVLLV